MRCTVLDVTGRSALVCRYIRPLRPPDALLGTDRRRQGGRRVRCTVLDVTGRSALVCRYIRPLRPPDALLGTDRRRQGGAEGALYGSGRHGAVGPRLSLHQATPTARCAARYGPPEAGGRRVRCTVLDVTGRSALVCRYIRPLRPPDALLGTDRRRQGGRRVRCTVLDVTGRSALVCRYIRPLRPPDALLGTDRRRQGRHSDRQMHC